jgi:hypothetical protein
LPADTDHETARLTDVLRDAAGQLAAVAGVRIAALHLGRDATLLNYVREIEDLLRHEGWARSIDAVLLVDGLDKDLEDCNYLIRGPEPRRELVRFS